MIVSRKDWPTFPPKKKETKLNSIAKSLDPLELYKGEIDANHVLKKYWKKS